MFSRRSELPGEAQPLAVLRERLVRDGRSIVDWAQGNPTSAGLGWPTQAVADAFGSEGWLHWEASPLGSMRAREAVAEHLLTEGVVAAVDDVIAVASTSEAYANLFKLLCDPGDEVLVPAPSYPLFDELARWEGVVLRPYRLAYAGSWHLDIDSVRDAIGPRTRAIVVVSPNNPTGSCLSVAELEALAQFGLPIVSDEVFSTSTASGVGRSLSALGVLGGHPHVVLDGLSKRLGLPQVKCGWMVLGGPRAFRTELRGRLEFALDAQLALGAPVQHALPSLLAMEGEARRCLSARLCSSEAAVRGAFGRSVVSVLQREAGWSLMLRIPTDDVDALCLRLVEERGIYAMPGSFFGHEARRHLVVSLLTAPEIAARCATELIELVEAE